MATPGSERKKQNFNSPSIIKIPFTPPPTNAQRSEKLIFSSFEQAFMMRRLSKYCYYDTVIVDFHQQYEEFLSSYEKYVENDQQHESQHHKGHPVFNRDKRYFTPSFVLGIDMIDYASFSQEDYQKFQTRVEQAEKKTDERNQKKAPQFFVPKPTGNKCQVCKQQYEDYLEHTKTEKHLKLFRKSKGWRYVNEFVDQFRKRPICKQSNRQKNKQNFKVRAKKSEQNEDINDVESGKEKRKYKVKTLVKTIPKQSISKKHAKMQKNAVMASATHSTVSPVQI